jgi:hypothetical protein
MCLPRLRSGIETGLRPSVTEKWEQWGSCPEIFREAARGKAHSGTQRQYGESKKPADGGLLRSIGLKISGDHAGWLTSVSVFQQALRLSWLGERALKHFAS